MKVRASCLLCPPPLSVSPSHRISATADPAAISVCLAQEWRVAESKGKLLVVACEPISVIAAVDPSAFPHASNALAYLDGGGQVIFNGSDDIVSEIRKFLA